jgi:hypothetical protein
MTYYLIFHPISIGVSAENRGPPQEVRISYPTLEAAIRSKDMPPPRKGYVAVKIVGATNKIYRERTIGQNIAGADSIW